MLVGAGDIARCDRLNDEATAAILDTIAGTVFTTGDNAYPSGSTTDFTSCYDPTWGRQRARTRPAVGDKDYQTTGASGYFSYFGAAAGDASQGYYSYDLTDWHVIVLNSGSSAVSTKLGSPQEQWLRADLVANTKRCILAYWQHPLFSSSGSAFNSSIKPLWDDLYAAHADIAVNGHYQVYERFAPQTPAEVADPDDGIRQFTVGTGGIGAQGFSTTIRPNSEVRSSGTFGVLELTLGAGAYSWQFIPVAGQTFTDTGSGACHDHVAVASVTVSPASTSVPVGESAQFTATPMDAEGNPLSGRTVTWQSSDGAVASVSPSGVALGLAEGAATITATSEGRSGSSALTVTAPPPGSPLILVGAGDIADCSSTRDEATAALLDNIPGTVFANGDNAYPNGAATDYSQCYAPSWGRHKARTRPAPGNHDYNTAGAAGYFGYYGPLAGDPGNGYYAYDLGDWQIISLNSNIAMSAGSPQEQWLRGALAASTKRCTLAYWHHPRFSSGTHHGSAVTAQPLWEALYAAGAEIVIGGHEHNYERFAPQTPAQTADPTSGIREFVAGTGGEDSYNDLGSPLPNSERFNGTTSGVLKLTLGSGTYSWEFIPIAGQSFSDAGSGACHAAPSTVSASPTTIKASAGSSLTTIRVTARDQSGNPVSGAAVVLAATGSGNTLSQPAGTTDLSGVATGTLSSTVAEGKTITATINGGGVTQTATITVTPATASALAFTVQPTSTTAGAAISPAVRVEVRDPLGNRVASATSAITLAIGTNPAGGTLLGTKTVAAVAGVATFSDLTIDLTGTGYTLRATSGSLTAATSTPFDISGGSVSVSRSTVSAVPTTIPASSGTATITVTTRDGSGNPVGGVSVSLAATGSGNTITQPAGPTDASGTASGTLKSTIAGAKTVTATANGLPLTQRPVVTVTADVPDAGQSTVAAAPSAIAAGGGRSTITVTVKDAAGSPVSGATVVLAATGSGNALTQPAGPTGANGTATGMLTSTVAESKTVSATANGTAITQTTTVTVTPPPPPGAIAQTLLTAGTNTANQQTYSTAAITPAANALVTVAVLEHNSSAAPPSPTLSGGGMTTWTEVASVTFDAVATPHRRLTIFRAMSAAPGSGPITITSSVTLSHCQWIVSQWAGAETGGVNGAGAIVQTGSSRGDAVNGLTVPLAAFGNANNIAFGVFGVRSTAAAVTPGAGFTEIAEQPSGESTPGDLEAEWATNLSTVAATWTNLNGGALGVEIKAASGAGSGVDPVRSTVVASPASIAAGNETSTITVTAKDASGTPVSGATVVLAATGTGNTVTQPVGPTDGSGVATGTLSSTVKGTKTVSAMANGTGITQTAPVTVTAGPVSSAQSTVAAAPTTIVATSGSSTITVTAKDDFGNLVSGATVVLAATGNGNTLTQPAAATDGNGVATGSLSSTVPEQKVVSATASATAITQTATVTVTNQAPATITQTLLTAGTDIVNQKIYTTAAVAPAPNTLITVAVLEHNSSAAPPSPTLSGGGMTSWTEVASVTFDAVATPHRRLTIFRALSAAPGSGPLTITSSVTLSHCQWIVSQWDGVETSGVNGAGAIVQTGSSRGDAVTGVSVPLAAFGSANNVAYGAFGVNRIVAVVAPGAGFTEIAEQPSGESTPGDLEAEWSTNHNVLDATWPLTLNGGALGVEIKARTGP